MNTDRLEALLWARVDGTIDPEELAELEAHLAKHPEPPEIERQITTIAEELDSLEKVQPPSELRERIDSALANATPPEARTEYPATTPHIRPAPAWSSRWLPLAASLVIGVTVGYLLHPGAGGSIDQSGVTGSMLTQTTHPVEIHLDAGSIYASRSGADVVIDVTLTTEIDLGLTLVGADGPVRFAGLNSNKASDTEVTTGQGWVAVRTRGPGTMTLAVSASDTDEPLRLQVSADGVPIEERWIGPSRNEPKP